MSRIVISASRRTDIPAFYMPWFMASIRKGTFEVINPYNQKAAVIPAAPAQVHSIVFWSKDFGPFLNGGFDRQLTRMGYRFFFNFTINSADPCLEPGVPPLAERLDQLAVLCRRYGPGCIQWRCDPICHWQLAAGAITTNLGDFQTIARHAAGLGIAGCITSFVDLYRKVRRRFSRNATCRLFDPRLEQKVDRVSALANELKQLGLGLALCCEKEVLAALPADSDVTAAACIPGHRLVELFGPGISTEHDRGQRTAAGCGCSVARDIGSYALHPCPHDCLFCYANPAGDAKSDSGSHG